MFAAVRQEFQRTWMVAVSFTADAAIAYFFPRILRILAMYRFAAAVPFTSVRALTLLLRFFRFAPFDEDARFVDLRLRLEPVELRGCSARSKFRTAGVC